MRLEPGMKAVIVGLGRSGLAVVQYLHRCGLTVRVSEARSGEVLGHDSLDLLERLGVELETGGHTEGFVGDADLVVISPGVAPDLPVLASVRARGVPVVGELALAAGRIGVPVIAVTGSNGKTTVSSLIARLLEADGHAVFLGGNIGTPLCEYLLAPEGVDVVVLEVSSFQLESGGSFRPDIALFLNFSSDHLDRHGGMDAYLAAKMRIFSNQRPDDWAILGQDDPVIASLEEKIGAGIAWFGSSDRCHARIEQSRVVLTLPGQSGQEETYDLGTTRLLSPVNRANSAAAILAARLFGCTAQGVRQGLSAFRPPAHRMTRVAVIDGVEFINDSKATNIGAVQAALSGYERQVVLIAGGQNKGSDFTGLRAAVRRHVKHLILLGESAEWLQAALGDLVPWTRVDSMAAAVQRAAAVSTSNDVVLLAPGCASFDMFRNYAERGEVFTSLVRKLAQSTSSVTSEDSNGQQVDAPAIGEMADGWQ